MEKLRILFLCTGNSCRSQMAEGWARHLESLHIEPYSAGIRPSRVDRRAVAVMAECGVDISSQRSKPVAAVAHLKFDCVVTVCDRARESCPLFPGRARVLHRSFDDPPRLAATAISEGQVLESYRRVRDEIRAYVDGLPGLFLPGWQDG